MSAHKLYTWAPKFTAASWLTNDLTLNNVS